MGLINVNSTALDNGFSGDVANVKNILKSIKGIEGIPYQFMENVDRRVPGASVGRKYAEKIAARVPLLFLTPCNPIFAGDFKDNDKSIIANLLLGGNATVESNDLIDSIGKYYTLDFAYDEYYQYLNKMLTIVATYMNLQDTVFNGNKIKNTHWGDETNSEFKTFFSSQENVVFYLDGLTEVSESYSNDTSESSLASQINGFSDTANEIKFLFGNSGGLAETLMDNAQEVTSSVTSSLSGLIGSLGGGIVGSVADKGINTILNGGKIIFPKIWSNSSATKQYSINIKLRSPDHDNLSIFSNIIKPYCRLLCLALPRAMDKNANGYTAPFMVKAYSKGIFNIDYGIITSMDVTKGAECCWNDDGLPTQMDITLNIEDLYSALAMSNNANSIVRNTSYMDFLAVTAGLNIAHMNIGRKVEMMYQVVMNNINTLDNRIFTKFDKRVSSAVGKVYSWLS